VDDASPLPLILDDAMSRRPVTVESVQELFGSGPFNNLEYRFRYCPPASLMSSNSRALLYCLVRMLDADTVAEIGTLFCGTTEVLARALMANLHGLVHTADPFGGERCPPIIAQWPPELQDLVRFYPEDSMAFLQRAAEGRWRFDLTLVDGNHDFEFVLFDLMMAARVANPGGVIVLDNFDLSGPLEAARLFLSNNSDWSELGTSMASWCAGEPFKERTLSFPGTAFLILKQSGGVTLKKHRIVSSGQSFIERRRIDGIGLRFGEQIACGRLHYNVHLREWASEARTSKEQKAAGHVDVDLSTAARLTCPFPQPLIARLSERHPDSHQAVEIELCWQPTLGSPDRLRLQAAPALLP